MRRRFHRAVLRLMVATAVPVVLSGCSDRDTPGGADGSTPEAAAVESATSAAAARSASIPPAMPFSTIADVLKPDNLTTVRDYLEKQVTYVNRDPEEFPAWERDVVRVCTGCEVDTNLDITAVMGTELLRPEDFVGKIRVLARVHSSVRPPEVTTERLEALGLVHGNPTLMAYQLVVNGSAAHFIYFDGAKFVESSTRWEFEATRDAHHLHHTMARWNVLGDVNHLSGTWISCLEGCCTSTPIL